MVAPSAGLRRDRVLGRGPVRVRVPYGARRRARARAREEAVAGLGEGW